MGFDTQNLKQWYSLLLEFFAPKDMVIYDLKREQYDWYGGSRNHVSVWGEIFDPGLSRK